MLGDAGIYILGHRTIPGPLKTGTFYSIALLEVLPNGWAPRARTQAAERAAHNAGGTRHTLL